MSFWPPLVKNPSGLQIKLYDVTTELDGGPHGSPVWEDIYTIPTVGSTAAFPSHMAAVLTLEGIGRAEAQVEIAGDPPTRPKQRKTGRVYLGPLNNLAGQLHGASNDAEPHATFRGAVFAALADLRDAAEALTCEVAVWSRANAAMYPLESASMDDAFDVVQSRKRANTARTRVTL